jgi:Ca2+/H+ antiporter, TMEM165/GDT1 family
MISWMHIGPSVTAAFLGSLVEFVEALTIVLAVGTVRGWRSALVGAAGGLLLLSALVALLGPALSVIPITALQLVIGLLLVLFGLNWLRKAILRSAGMIPLHDEGKVYQSATAALREAGAAIVTRWDTIAVVTTFKAVVLEGLEIVFIVLAVGTAGHMIVPAALGAAAAGLVVALAGVALHRPLARVPENTLKFAVGVLIASFGVFWVGEGLGVHWPGADFSILGLAAAFLVGSLLTIRILRRQSTTALRRLPGHMQASSGGRS